MKAVLIFVAISLAAATGGAFAGDRVSARIDVNIRSGPGANYPIVEILHAGQAVATRECPKQTGWCSVTAPGGGEGWIAAKFLSPAAPDAPAPSGSTAASASPSPDSSASENIDTTTTSAIPTVGSPAAPLVLPESVVKYVATHRPLSVDFGGKPAVGTTIPTAVRLRDIPGSRYQYVYVDGRPVFVDGQSRRVVQVEP